MTAATATPLTCTRGDVARFRFRRHQLDRPPGETADPDAIALLDYGVQDTGPDGAAWALAIRGAQPPVLADLVYAWSLRAAPHAYRRADIEEVAVATAPYSEADATKRVFDASKPLRAAGIPVLDALRTVATLLRDIVEVPRPKGEASTALTGRVEDPYLRFCRSCDATHVYENPFRLAALQAGLELEPGSSPPVLRRIAGVAPNAYERLAVAAEPRLDVIRNYLRFYGPARVKDAAAYLDAAASDVKAHWPEDAVEVRIDGVDPPGRPPPRYVLTGDVDELADAANPSRSTLRLVGPYDPYLQLRDREVLVEDGARRKALWPVLGRPGAILLDGEVAGTWRPRTSGRRLTVVIEPWRALDATQRAQVDEQAERLAAHRDVALAAVSEG